MSTLDIEDPNEDEEAKVALWKAICHLADKARSKWGLNTYLSSDQSEPISKAGRRPNDEIWKLVEVLCVFVLLNDAERVHAASVYNLRKKISAPIQFTKLGEPFYLWTQTRMAESLSGFTGTPDIAITTTNAPPSRANATDVIEVKSGKITSRLIRQEFAKGFDLKLRSYSIWSLRKPTPGLIEGARLLGIDLEPIDFRSPMRAVLLNPDMLVTRFADRLVFGRNDANFERVLEQTGQETVSKRQQRLQR